MSENFWKTKKGIYLHAKKEDITYEGYLNLMERNNPLDTRYFRLIDTKLILYDVIFTLIIFF